MADAALAGLLCPVLDMAIHPERFRHVCATAVAASIEASGVRVECTSGDVQRSLTG
jgi:hypothetical protein